MGIGDLRLKLGRPDITMRYADGGRKQVFTLGDNVVEVPNNASTDTIAAALMPSFVDTLNEQQPNLKEVEKQMSITGAQYVAGSIKDKIQAAKDRMSKVTSGAEAAVAKLNAAADAAEQLNKSIEAEADNLMAEIGQFSNGSPA